MLEHERARQKEHLLAQLKERSKKSKSLTDERRLIEQFKADVESKDRAFDEDALGAMASSQTKILLNLAAIFADDETLLSSRERSLDDDDFDTYLEDSGGHGSQGLARWLQDSEGVADAYVSAGLELQRRVQGAHRSENGIASISDDSIVIEELEGEDAGASSVLPVLSHMTTVIVDAFTYHIKSAGGQFLRREGLHLEGVREGPVGLRRGCAPIAADQQEQARCAEGQVWQQQWWWQRGGGGR